MDPLFDTLFDTIVVPQGAEYQAVRRGLRRARVDVPIVSIAIGPEATKNRLNRALADGWKPRRVLVTGVAGSLAPLHQVGDRVVYECCQLSSMDDRAEVIWRCDGTLLHLCQSRLGNLVPVRALSSPQLVATPAMKAQFYQHTQATVVDMEAAAIVQTLLGQTLLGQTLLGQTLLGSVQVEAVEAMPEPPQPPQPEIVMIRVISDGAQTALPDLSGTVDATGGLKPLALAGAMVRQPRAALNLIQGSLQALAQLEKAIAQLFGAA